MKLTVVGCSRNITGKKLNLDTLWKSRMRLQIIHCILLQLIFELSSCTHLRVIPGYSLELPCLAFQADLSGASITWTFNDKDVLASGLEVKKDGLILSISTVTAAHEGQYVCLLKENNMELINTYDITVVASTVYNIKAAAGSDVKFPCYFPTDQQVNNNALWFKDTNAGKTKLNLEDENNNKMEHLFPLERDQTVLLRDAVMEDGGVYHCESEDGQKLSTVNVVIDVDPTPEPHSCQNLTAPWEACLDENSRTGEPILQESMTEFSMKLYSYLRALNPASNLLFSPVSISGLLTHLLLGAREDTRNAIERAVFVPHNFHCVHFYTKKLREKLDSSLQMASQIYYNPGINVSESFIDQSIQFYEAEPTKLLENSEENAKMINSWVANKTQNKITHLVDKVSPHTQLMLLNAVSFNGQWQVKFELKGKKGNFIKMNGDLVKVPVLHQQKYKAAMTHDVELQAQVAKFALTGGSSLYILLPRTHSATHLQQVEERMTDTAVLQMIERMKTTPLQQIDVTLPQIKLDVEPDMNILLKKLGLSSLSEGANLCGLYSEDKIILDDARHRAFLALTEKGVEAGAVTSASFSRSFPTFSALRPFIMLLWSDEANVPLFVGRVTEPQ
ncbi:Plasma protease C1 inhibitor [Channa argus]|uniref:Plasma protease C1 inhibitor n=1 Tax=Channa argus TaxID=215402 RepID=A0A6G1PBJ2_CHAAH|nr:Plasma protease C1 inhibitor [Channa argus]KAK2918963.1 hypothetical protein Q8A73_003334 [Channa argus]